MMLAGSLRNLVIDSNLAIFSEFIHTTNYMCGASNFANSHILTQKKICMDCITPQAQRRNSNPHAFNLFKFDTRGAQMPCPVR